MQLQTKYLYMAIDWGSIGDKAKEGADELGSKVKSLATAVDPRKKVAGIVEGLPDMPIIGGMTGQDVNDTVTKPKESKLDETFRKLTGIDAGGFSAGKLKNHLADKLAGMKDLIVGVLMSCIRKWLMQLMSKFPLLGLILNLDRAFGEFSFFWQ